MDREQIEKFLNNLIDKKIVIKMKSDYCSCIMCMRPENIDFLEGIHESRFSDSFIKHCYVSISDKDKKFQIEYEDIENIKYKDTERNQFYELQLIYRNGTTIQIYSEETF